MGIVITGRPFVVLTIIKINIIVFLFWILGANAYPMLMIKNFLVSWEFVTEGRVWTLVTSVFSHNMLFHLLVNMFVFYGFGSTLETIMGHKRFIAFYLMAGIVASLGHCFVSSFLLHEPGLPALGASGAVAGVIVLFSFLFPKEKLLLLGLIPMPAFVGAILFVGLDIWGLVAQTQGSSLPIGYGAHLGGAFFGVFYYFAFIRKSRKAF